jgi:hypothetical protein
VLALVVILVFEHSRFLAERAAKEP